MNREEFKKKYGEVKRQMEKIMSELEDCDAYIYNQYDFRHFHFQIKEYLNLYNYVLENCDERQTSEKFHENTLAEALNNLRFVSNKWEKLKKVNNEFIPPR